MAIRRYRRPTFLCAEVFLAIILVLAGPVWGGQPKKDSGGATPRPASAASYYATSWALLIGIDQYKDVRIPRLRYAANDVRGMETVLHQLGFRTITLLNEQATKRGIEDAFDRLNELAKEDRLVVFFSGHGESVKLPKGSEEGFLIPYDADRGRLVQTGIPMRDIDRLGERVPPKHILFFLDACHSGFAFVGFRDIEPEQKGDAYYASATQKPAVQVFTAGETGQKAAERDGQGIFTRWLVQGLQGAADLDRDGIITANELAAWVEPQVTRDSRGIQKPVFGRLLGEGQFLFELPGRQPRIASVPPSPPPTPTVREEVRQEVGVLAFSSKVPGLEVWLGSERIGETKAGVALVVENLAVGRYRVRAQKQGYKAWESEVQVAANQRAELLIDPDPLGPPPVIKGEDGAEMVLVPAGEFWMGTTQKELDRVIAECKQAGVGESQCKGWYEAELPRHRVAVGAFYLDRYEVTNALFEKFVKATSHGTTAEQEGSGLAWIEKAGKWQGELVKGATWRTPAGPGSTAPSDHPVVQVSWGDAKAYCQWAGKRLPTEAEWEYAARGTDGRRYPWGENWDPNKANGAMTVRTTKPVGSYPGGTSPFNIHDLAGNVWEWTSSLYKLYPYSATDGREDLNASGRRVFRGGSWFCLPWNLRAAFRVGVVGPTTRDNSIGFRCAQAVQ